jgi:hypothetical protein
MSIKYVKHQKSDMKDNPELNEKKGWQYNE